MPVAPVNAVRIAVVLDNKVEEVLMAEGRLAALLLSSPDFIEIEQDIQKKPTIGWTYKDNQFLEPELLIDQEEKEKTDEVKSN